jgi:hypothetical protein
LFISVSNLNASVISICCIIGLLSISNERTIPKPCTSCLPFGISSLGLSLLSLFCSVFGGSFGLSSFVFGSLLASCFGCSTSTARGDETISGALFVAIPAGGVLIGLRGELGLTGEDMLVTFVALLTHVLFVSTQPLHTGLPYGSGQDEMLVSVTEPT